MHVLLWSRKMLGKFIDYTITINEIQKEGLLEVTVSCKSPQTLFAMLEQTPALISKQLMNLALDAIEKHAGYTHQKEIISSSCKEKEIWMRLQVKLSPLSMPAYRETVSL